MKNLTLIIVLFLTSHFVFAQQIELSEAPRAKENGTYNSFLFELPDVDQDEASNDWEKFMKNYKGKTKYNRKTKLYVTEEAKMSGLSRSPVTVYARILEDKNPNKRTSVIVWFDAGGDSYVNSEMDSGKGKYAKELLTEYGLLVSKHHAQSIVEAEERRLKDLEKDMDRLKRDNTDYHKEIDKSKENIAKNEKNVEVNELDQQNKATEIKVQKEMLELAKENVKKFN